MTCGIREAVVDSAPFETIPAWRIARLRIVLRDAEHSGADPQATADDFAHRALIRRFALGRTRAANAAGRTFKAKTTRKGKGFSLAKKVAIWRAIIDVRPPAWKQGDKAPFGSIRRAHNQAVTACRAIGVTPPRYRTIYVLWHRGQPSAEVRAALAS
jgi:hypothetical protein